MSDREIGMTAFVVLALAIQAYLLWRQLRKERGSVDDGGKRVAAPDSDPSEFARIFARIMDSSFPRSPIGKP